MWQVHNTRGFVIGGRPYREGGRLLQIFTRDFGLVWAIAEGIRLQKSKLRYSAQDHSYGQFSLIHGKEFWRLTSATEEEKITSVTRSEIAYREIVARLAVLIERFLKGEEKNEELFTEIESVFSFLGSRPDKKILEKVEILMVLRLLYWLGYIGKDQITELFIADHGYSDEIISVISIHKKEVVAHINKAFKESHL